MKKNTKHIDYNLIERFLEMLLAERACANNTVESYKNDILKFSIYCHNVGVNLLSASFQDIQNYFFASGASRSSSVARRLSSIKQFYKFLCSEGVLRESPAEKISAPKKASSLPRPISREDIQKILNVLEGISTNEENNPQLVDLEFEDTNNTQIAQRLSKQDVARNKAIIEVLYSTGMRVSELINLKKTDIKEVQGNYVVQFVGKGMNERFAVLNEHAVAALSIYEEFRLGFAQGVKTALLFPSVGRDGKVQPISRQRIGQILKSLAKLAGIDEQTVSPHKFRHSLATHMLQNGADIRSVQEILGHRSISSTQIYTKVTSDHAKKTVMQKHPMGSDEPL